MRYIIADSVNYDGQRSTSVTPYTGPRYRFVYDTKFKHFALVQKKRGRLWVDVKYVDSNFYVLFPGHAKTRESDKAPNWPSIDPNTLRK